MPPTVALTFWKETVNLACVARNNSLSAGPFPKQLRTIGQRTQQLLSSSLYHSPDHHPQDNSARTNYLPPPSFNLIQTLYFFSSGLLYWLFNPTKMDSVFSFTCRGIILYTAYQSVCPFVGIGSPHPLPRKQVCPSPWTQRREGSNTRLGVRGWRRTQFGRLDRKPGTLKLCREGFLFLPCNN